MNDVTTLYDFATELLTEAEAALATTTAGVPDRAFVSPSLPAFDCCPQLTVHVQSLSLENTSPTAPSTVIGLRTQLDQVDLTTLAITIVRCSPQPSGAASAPPSPEAIQTFSQTVLEDLWALWNWLTDKIREGSLFEGKCMGVYLNPASSIDDQGGCAGWLLTVTTSIQGYHAS